MGIAEWVFLLGASRINVAWEKFLAAGGTALTGLEQLGGNEIFLAMIPMTTPSPLGIQGAYWCCQPFQA